MYCKMDDKERFRSSAKTHGVDVYSRILENTRTNLKALLKKRQEIEEQMRSLQRITNTVLAVCEEDAVELPSDLVLPFDEDVPLSISLVDAVRAVLKQQGLVGLPPSAQASTKDSYTFQLGLFIGVQSLRSVRRPFPRHPLTRRCCHAQPCSEHPGWGPPHPRSLPISSRSRFLLRGQIPRRLSNSPKE